MYGYDIGTKAQTFQWKRPEELRPKKASQVRSNVSLFEKMLTTFNDETDVVEKVITGEQSWVYGYDIETKPNKPNGSV